MDKHKRFATIFWVLCGFVLPNAAIAESVTIWGSTTCQKQFLEPAKDELKEKTGIDSRVVGVGSGKGLIALIAGKTQVAAVSGSLKAAIKSAKDVIEKSGMSIDIPDNLVFHQLSQDRIVSIVHIDNPVSHLTWEQLKDINTGKISNWKELNGPDLPIQVVTSHKGSATRGMFQRMVMQKQAYIENAIEVRSTRAEIDVVATSSGSIGAISQKFLEEYKRKVKTIQSQEITRPLGLITMGKASTLVQSIIDFFQSDDGKRYFSQTSKKN